MIVSHISSNNCNNVNFNAKLKLKLTPNKVVRMLPYSTTLATCAAGSYQVLNANSILNEDIYGKQMLKETEVFGYLSMITAPFLGASLLKILDDTELDIKSDKDIPS